MINEELTFKEFGYYSYDLKPKASKKIVAICDVCGKVRKVKKQCCPSLCGSCVKKGKQSHNKGKKCMFKLGEVKMIPEEIQQQYLNDGWSSKEPKEHVIKRIDSMKRSNKGLRLMHNVELNQEELVEPEQVQQYLYNGWVLGMSKEHRSKLGSDMHGKNSPFYIDGRTLLNYTLSTLIHSLPETGRWRKDVFERDNYTCQDCNRRGGNLHAHHIKEFYKIVIEFLQTYPQFSPIEDKETLLRLALTYKPFWELINGKTLCEKCHKIFHKNKNNILGAENANKCDKFCRL